MKSSITQKDEYGCGVACFAFVNDISYQQAVSLLGRKTSVRHGWRPADLVRELNKQGYNYKNRYVRHSKNVSDFDSEGTIVLLERSGIYPFGHYLVRYHDQWMDPWINLLSSSKLEQARSGYRSKLPGKVMYALRLEV